MKGEIIIFNFSIMPLDELHIDEICEDIKNQYRATLPADSRITVTGDGLTFWFNR